MENAGNLLEVDQLVNAMGLTLAFTIYIVIGIITLFSGYFVYRIIKKRVIKSRQKRKARKKLKDTENIKDINDIEGIDLEKVLETDDNKIKPMSLYLEFDEEGNIKDEDQ
ncbi:MAG: hypothetical protein IJ593_04235 [Lachnospiraceae bacterium]|nr:hypothetical protein [Lachnospiraceae bacterium]